MNKFEKVGLTSVLGLAILGTTVFAKTGKVYNTSQGLVLRGSASKTGEPLATVANGAEVEILEENEEWYKVNANGKEGFLFAEYVEIQKEETETPADTSTTQTENTIAGTKIYVLPVITSTVIGEVPENTDINIEKTVGKWNYIVSENVKGWVRANSQVQVEEPLAQDEETKTEEAKSEETTETEKPKETESTPAENTDVSFRKGYINSSSVNVRKEPSTSSEIVTTLVLNTGVTISAQTDEWYKIVYGDYMGYIYKPLISETPVATSRSSETRTTQDNSNNTNTQAEAPVSTSSSGGDKIVSFAKQYLGYKYVYGGTTPSGFDCSGFVYYVFNNCGYSLSRSCSVQAQSGTAVSRENLIPGDILFFNNTSNGSIGHVGIYIGDGRFIHAANPSRGVVTDTINSGYYNTYYYSARRVAN